ncbi:unnamed protein product [Rotaria socialis]|uniref:Uncharacterized protein n=1 Tax=Rotaria socialis TaxID=392032 RepID=A0A817MKU5_9BILA|nr:unnamed protein product [Rotaria socialis]CAF3524009.1 unnamed protein product [Rotaria socialis]
MTGSTRSAYQRRHFCMRTVHLLVAHPIYSCLLLFIMYLQIMDIILYFKIRSRGPLHSNTMIDNDTKLFKFISLSVKDIIVGHFTHYIRSPLAELIESKLHFTDYFPFISANAISFFHCCLSVISIRFFSSDSLLKRRIGVFIFVCRNFLDCLDGIVYRAHKKNSVSKSHNENLGYYVDGLSDVLAGICLMTGCLLHFYKQRPFRPITDKINQTPSKCTDRSNDYESDDTDSVILNIGDEQNIQTSDVISSDIVETKRTIFITLILFSLRYALAGLFWDKHVIIYDQLLDSYTNQSRKLELQLTILHSRITILMLYLWRYLGPLSVQDYLVVAVFFDRTWEFIQKTNNSKMENNDLTFWKNYQAAMQWIQGNTNNCPPTLITSGYENTLTEEDNKALEFTIDDDLLDFYRLSRDHKANRKTEKSQEKSDAEQFEIISGEQMRPSIQSISKLPPLNRSKLRQLELEWLYGSANSSKIHARETHLQMEFDQIFDRKQPSYFPSLPNRLQLDPDSFKQRTSFPTITILNETA